MGEWLADNWIALLALVGAAVGWLDNRWRLTISQVRLKIEQGPKHRVGDLVLPGEMLLRNVGERVVYHPEIDPASVTAFQLEYNVSGRELQPQQSASFKLLADPRTHRLPDSVVVRYRLRLGGPIRSVHVQMPELTPVG